MIQRTNKKQKTIRAVGESKQLEVRYRRELDALLKVMLEIALSEIRENDKPLNDALPDYMRNLSLKMRRIFDKLDTLDLPSIANRMSSRIVGTANKVNMERFAKQASKSFGIDFTTAIASSGEAVRTQLDIDRELNAGLIKKVATNFKQDIAETIMTNIQSGERSTNLITQIKERYNVRESDAKRIARDQTSKLNGSLVKARAQAVGSKTYIWRCVSDERSRDSHKAMNGMLCKMDNPKVFSDNNGKTWKNRKSIGGVELHPSEDFQCRCNMQAVIEF